MLETLPTYRTLDFGPDRPVTVDATPAPADWAVSKFVKVDLPFPTPMVCYVENLSEDVVLTLDLAKSSDDGAADAFAAVNMRYNGANVSSIAVQPGGRAVFTVEAIDEKFLRWKATPGVMEAPVGKLTMLTWLGNIDVYAPALDTANFPLS